MVHDIVRIRRAAGQVVRLTGSAGVVRGRPGDVATVLQNLLVNAAAHAPASPVTVTVADADGAGADGMVEVRVSDRGPGLTPEEATHVFDRGARGAHSGGSGLGLYVARSLMRRSGGDVGCATASRARRSSSCCRPSSGGPTAVRPGSPARPAR